MVTVFPSTRVITDMQNMLFYEGKQGWFRADTATLDMHGDECSPNVARFIRMPDISNTIQVRKAITAFDIVIKKLGIAKSDTIIDTHENPDGILITIQKAAFDKKNCTPFG